MKTLKNCLLIISALTAYAAMATVPTGYYNSLNGKKDQALKNAVHDLTARHTKLSYNSLWYYYVDTDPYPDDPTRVWDMYSDIPRYFSSNRGTAVSGMNKEHSFPKSWWGGSSNVDAYSDLFHIIPADATANSKRSNHPFAELKSTSWTNGVSKTGTPKDGQGGGSSVAFEPADQYKGDFARIYFYMVSCYQDYTWNSTYMLSNSDWRTLTQWSIDLLLDWARQDPVSEKEINRNEAIFTYQNNRNPFVDNPELMEFIWGNRVGEAYSDTVGPGPNPNPNPNEPTLITPTQGTLLDFGEVQVGDTADLTLYVRGQHFTEPLTLKVYRYDYKLFDISTTTIDTLAANSEEGYELHVTYAPTALGDHRAKILFSGGGMAGSIGIDLQGHCVNSMLTGDVNRDGIVDVSDLNIIVNCILGIEDNEFADINGDDVIDVSDVNLISDIILKIDDQ